MKMTKSVGFSLLVLAMFLFNSGWAQTSKSKEEKSSYFRASANYLSNSVYYGRRDSLPYPYLTPSIGYYDKSGFSISGSVSYLMSSNESRIDLGTIDLGYDFEASDKFSGQLYASKSWYNQGSTNIKSDIKGNAGGMLSYDLNALQVNGGIDLAFANKMDIGLNLGVSHLFTIGEEDDQFSIEPSFVTNWSTLHSYEGYISRKIGKRPGNILPAGANVTAVTNVQNNKMTLLDYEFSIPLLYENKKIGVSLTPTFALPKNPIYTTTTVTTKLANGTQSSITKDSTPDSEKTLSNNFYVELEFFIKF
jgi:hypothetical protein